MGDFSWAECLARLLRGEDLGERDAAAAMREIMGGEATPAQIGAFLVALRAKGETADEIVGLARTMRDFSLKVEVEGPLIDTCGTGGDRAGTVNISTMAALVAAGAGARVAKHGNRAASSRCGSADLLEALGVAIDLEPDGVASCIREAGIGFCFAPLFHPAMKHAGPVRREIGIPTVFNFLGPLTNPAGATRQTVGVADPFMAPKMAEALLRLGSERALVFRGDDGLDELTTTTTSRIWEVGPQVVENSLDPRDLGISLVPAAALAGSGPRENAKSCESVLAGDPGPVRDAVALNAAAALLVGGLAGDWADGLARAREAIDSGAARGALERLRAASQSARRPRSSGRVPTSMDDRP
ncbi:MAG: anthranilate phosphoribosyltransferase [Acidobacteria bacterium]|nr:anthranilate phosphoribosyltransferase [Acidobacteriota bacterium]